ncbi:MAG: GNAT family N-acetyltransferase [Clostridia bacterium]|nr:GNAT family N-acetyltransferase [Clostridia bacterium]
MTELKRTDGMNKDFLENCELLDEELDRRSGKILDRNFFRQFAHTNDITEAVVAYVDDKPAGAGAIRRYDETSTELKRMFVRPEYQGMGIASKICKELEKWAKECGYQRILIETGKHLTEANALYQKMGYSIIPNYPPYEKEETSVCFEKLI